MSFTYSNYGLGRNLNPLFYSFVPKRIVYMKYILTSTYVCIFKKRTRFHYKNINVSYKKDINKSPSRGIEPRSPA